MPELETARLYLRPFEPGDLDALALMFADPEVMRFLPAGQGISRERTQAALSRYIESWETNGYGLYAVIEKSSSTLIGHCGLSQLDHTDEIELAYGLRRASWGKGYATEAARACLRFGFEELNLDRIVGIVVPENIASQRILEKLGMQYIREAEYYNLQVRYYELSRLRYRQALPGTHLKEERPEPEAPVD